MIDPEARAYLDSTQSLGLPPLAEQGELEARELQTTGFRAATHDDAQFAAAVQAATEPDHSQIAEELLERWINTEKGSAVRRFVVQEDGVDGPCRPKACPKYGLSPPVRSVRRYK